MIFFRNSQTLSDESVHLYMLNPNIASETV